MQAVRVLQRLRIPVVALMAIGCGEFAVSCIHGAFGAEKRPAYADGRVDGTKLFNPKQVFYQIFGLGGAVAGIGYFDVNSGSQHVDGVRLPWSLQISTAVVGDIVAQGDSYSGGCRIVVADAVEVDRIANEVNAHTHWLVKGA